MAGFCNAIDVLGKKCKVTHTHRRTETERETELSHEQTGGGRRERESVCCSAVLCCVQVNVTLLSVLVLHCSSAQSQCEAPLA